SALDSLRAVVVTSDEQVGTLRGNFDVGDRDIRTARHALDAVKAEVMRFEVARAKASSDMAHLAETCHEAVGLSLDEVAEAVARLQAAGELKAPASRLVTAGDEEDDSEPAPGAGTAGAIEAAMEVAQQASAVAVADAPVDDDDAAPAVDPDEVIGVLRGRIDRLGP